MTNDLTPFIRKIELSPVLQIEFTCSRWKPRKELNNNVTRC